jgi:hypothetical protein
MVMTEPTIETLTQRLDRVERENRRMKQAGVITLAVIAAVGLMGQATGKKVPKVIEAEKFVLRDTEGNSRGELTVIAGGSIMRLADEDGNTGAALIVVPDGRRVLELSDKNGVRAEFTVRDDLAHVLLYDKSFVPRIGMEVQPDGRPFLHVADKNGKSRAQLFVAANDTPFLGFYDRDDDRTFVAGMGVAKDGSMALALTDRDEESSVQLKIPRGGQPHLRFYGRKGKVIWSAP